MHPIKLTMSKAELSKWGRDLHRKSKGMGPLGLIQIATEDYASFRCLLYNGMLCNSLVFAAQAIEKMLKAHLVIDYQGNVTKYNHNLVQAAKALKSYKVDSESLKLYSFLSDAYDINRYPDNEEKILKKNGGRFSQSSTILSRVDEEMFSLVDNLPAPPEVRYRSHFFLAIFDDKNSYLAKVGELITKENSNYKKNDKKYREDYFKVLYFHYPSLAPGIE